MVICMDEFGPLNLQPHPGRQWARRPSAQATRPSRADAADGRPTPARTACAT